MTGDWGLVTGDWGLVTGDWGLGTGDWGLVTGDWYIILYCLSQVVIEFRLRSTTATCTERLVLSLS
ncbi:MAG: hypothetical protein ACKPBB_12585 [Sphaerospermopsis kisseleviana]